MQSRNHPHSSQPPACFHLSPAGVRRGIRFHRVLALLLLMSAAASLRAGPVVDNNAGYFFDNYADNGGIFSSSQVQIAPPGTVSLSSPNASGNYRTAEIVPTSFDQWGLLTIVGSYGALNDLRAEVRSEDGLTVLIAAQPVNVPINLSGLSPALVPGIRVQVYFNKSAAVAPTVDSLRVTWRPVSRLLLDKQGPATVQAGETIGYDLRYSVSYVEGQNLVIYDTLASGVAGTLVYPVAYGQNDDISFVSATKNGLYHAGPGALVVNGVSVPPNSVYWNLATVAEGTTDLLSFMVATKRGTLDLTRATNCAYAKAANSDLIKSPRVVTTIRSAPGPWIRKGGGAGIYQIGGESQTIAGTTNSFGISVRNDGNETMYNSVMYDHVSDLVTMINNRGTPAAPADDFFNISPGGIYVPNYNPLGTGPFPAIVWTVGTLPPGGSFSGSFSVQLLASPPRTMYSNRACLTSDRTTPVCDQIVVKIGLSESALPLFNKSGPSRVPHGGNAVFGLSVDNSSAVKLNGIVVVDRVPTNATFRSAWFNDPKLFLSGARIFYSTSMIVPQDWNNPPPFDYLSAPADLDVGLNTHWERYDLTPPVNPAAVTWLGYFFPQVDSPLLPDNGTPALPSPPTPITSVAGFYDVTVFSPANPCADDVVYNRALFEVNQKTSLSGVKAPIPGGPLRSANDWPVAVIGTKAGISTSSGISPGTVVLPGNSTYYLTVANSESDALNNVQVVIQLSQMAVNGVLQYPSVQGISPPGTYSAATGRITILLGLMPQGTSRPIEVQLGLLAGTLSGSEYTLAATVTGQGVRCGPATDTGSARGRVESSPKLTVRKSQLADLIPSGAEYTNLLQYQNLGNSPSTGTWIVDRVPARTVLVWAFGNVNITDIRFSAFDNLPPQVLTPLMPITAATIASYFSLGVFNNNGTPGSLSDDFWTSPFGDQTHWVAWRVDNSALNPPQVPINTIRTVGLRLRNDDNGVLPGTAGSPEGTLIFNTAGIFSSELLQAIGNQVITRIDNDPSILVEKSGPSVVEAGVPFNWVVTYRNNTLQNPDNTVNIIDTLPPGITFLSATHTWNAAAVAHGAPGGAVAQTVVPAIVNNLDGSTSLSFPIAGVAGYRGNGVPLDGLEGATITLRVQSDAGTPCGSTRLNAVCGTATTAADTVTSCAEHQVTILCPELGLLKYASPASVLSGGTLTYQIVLANSGGIAARDVALIDTLPAGVTYLGSLSVSPGYTLAAPIISGQTLTWSVANGRALTRSGRPPGEVPASSGNIIIQFSARVGADVAPCTTLNNLAQVSTVSVEEGVYPNTATATASVPPADLAVAKSGPELARPGNRVSWDVTWVNQTAQPATGVYLVETLPNYDVDPNSDVTFVSVTLPAGVTAYYHSGPVSPVPAFNPAAPLTGGWAAAPASPSHVAFLVGALAGNAGPFTAQVTVDLIDPNGGTPVLPQPGVCFTNTVVIHQAVPACENLADNTATAIVCTPALDLALTKTGSVQGALPGATPGQPITYTIKFQNTGTVRAYGVRIADTLPAALLPGSPLDNFNVVSLVDAAGNPVSAVDLSGTPIPGAVPVTRQISGSTITWHLGTTTPSDALYYQKVGITPGSSGSFQLYVTVGGSVADNTGVCNGATVFADVGTEDQLGNNTGQSCVTVHRADVAVRKSGKSVPGGSSEFVEFGDLISYTLEYNNLGGATAHDVVLRDYVPNGTTLESLNLPPGATVTYFPSQANATSFEVRFPTLLAPANSVSGVGNAAAPAPSNAQPRLFIELVTNGVQLSWDAAYAGFVLEKTPTLSDSNSWTAVQTPVTSVSTNRIGVTLPNSSLACFFRLRGTPVAGCTPGNYQFPANVNPACFLNWNRLFVQDTVPQGSVALYSVGRRTSTNVVFDLGSTLTHVSIGPDGLDLTGVNRLFTNLVLQAEYSLTTGSNSPCLTAWQFTYDSPCWPSFTFTVRVNGRGADSCGALAVKNTASISTITPEITLANNSAAHNMLVLLTDLKVNMSVDKAAALPAETLAYQINWSVIGPQAAPKTYVKVTLPDGNADGIADVTLVNPFVATPGVVAYYHTASTLSSPAFDPNNPPGGGWIQWTISAPGANHLAFALGDRDPNSTNTIAYMATVNSGTAGRTLVSTAAGFTARRESDCDNSGSALTYIGRLANVLVTKTGPGCLHPGNLAIFTINYGNNGNTAAVNVVVSDVLPSGLTFVSAVPAPSSVSGQTLTWNNLGTPAGSLAPGASGVILVTAQLANDCTLIGKSLANVANISTRSDQVTLADDRAEAALNCITPDVVNLSGYVYHDRNGNCVREPGEGGIAGVLVTLTGTVPCGPPVTATATTDSTGQYNFPGLPPGTYTVTETQPSTWVSTGDALGTISSSVRGTNLQPLDNILGPITINGGELALEYNFCENRPVPVFVGVPGNTNYQCLGDVPPPPTVTATNNCDGNTTVTLTIATNGTCPTVLTYTWVANDRCGNSSSATSTVTVLDTIPPVLAGVPGNTNFQCLGEVPAFNVTAADNCEGNIPVALTITTNGSCPIILTYTWVARDRCTNSITATRTVTVHDTIPPVLSGVPGNSNFQCLSDVPPFNVTANDNCDGNLPVALTITTNGSCPAILNYTWVARDRCTNSVFAVRTFTVRDTIPPVLAGVPGDTNYQCLGDVPAFTVTANDNCEGSLPVALTITTNGSCPTVLTYTWFARDRCTNSTTASRTITVRDTVPPVLSGVPGNTEYHCLGDVPPPASVSAADNCDGNLPVALTITTNGSCPLVVTYTWTARDRCTNSTTASRSVTVRDTLPPVITCSSNKTVLCGSRWSFDPPTATDNCGPATIGIPTTITNSQPGNRFTVTRCWTATDACSNSATCCQTVTVITECAPLAACTVPYPFASANPRTSLDFNESEVLRAFNVSVSDQCLPQQIRLFYNDEHALVLGVRRVIVKTATGSTTNDYPVTALPNNPGGAFHPFVGTTATSGDQAGTDLAGRPMFPSLFITDITADPGSLAGDWQYGGTPIPPHAVFGTWKAAVRTVDKTRGTVTVTPDADPAKNDWNLDGGDPAPAGLVNEGYGAEVRWDIAELGLLPGHQYRLYFMVHDGDQNKTGGDTGHGCATLDSRSPTTCPPAPCPTCALGYPYASSEPRTSVVFNEDEVLRGFSTNVVGPGDSIKVWYNDEHALLLGVRRQIVKNAGGRITNDYPITPLLVSPSCATNPLVGDLAATDPSARPIFPALFITDTTADPSSRAGDWQFGGAPIPAHAVCGSWKAAIRTVDNTVVPPAITVDPDDDPAQNDWDLAGGGPVPAGLVNQGYGAEVRWDLASLGLIPGHSYRFQFMVHDGDQNKVGGDVGQGCLTVCFQEGAAAASPAMRLANVIDPQPRLSLLRTGESFLLQWPDGTAPGFVLETTTNLAQPESWSVIKNATSPLTVTNTPAAGERFYRVRRP